jgi:hypothetical protein
MQNGHKAGKSTREMADRRRRNGILVGIIVLLTFVVLGLFLMNADAWGIGGAAVLGILLAMRFLSDWLEGYERGSRKRERRAIRGARSEEAVGALLEALGPDYFVLHDVASPCGNIDHIVIGRGSRYARIERGPLYRLSTIPDRDQIPPRKGRRCRRGHPRQRPSSGKEFPRAGPEQLLLAEGEGGGDHRHSSLDHADPGVPQCFRSVWPIHQERSNYQPTVFGGGDQAETARGGDARANLGYARSDCGGVEASKSMIRTCQVLRT